LYYLNSRYYNPEWSRFISADALGGKKGEMLSHNVFGYCFNNPINITDESGNWPKWIETTMKVVAVAAVITTATMVVVGTGGAAAPIPFFAALGGFIGGFANEKNGGSFTNGWIGGAVNGAIQALGTKYAGAAGTILGGGLGSGTGTAIMGTFDNLGKPISKRKSVSKIVKESVQSAAVGTATSVLAATMNVGVDYAIHNNFNIPGLMPGLTPGFGEGIKAFFGAVDDEMTYIFPYELFDQMLGVK
jgi:hypothetical protein